MRVMNVQRGKKELKKEAIENKSNECLKEEKKLKKKEAVGKSKFGNQRFLVDLADLAVI
jgi:hypothetical protein